jgi:hypothetical protein
MNDEKQSRHDLQHYLKLALAQLQVKIQNEKTVGPGFTEPLRQMMLLEELIKEQVPTK